jgi:GNAT superfamily N-acetyltransferase
MGTLTIRRAFEADSHAIASIHVRGWQWAYRGHLPDAFLDGLTATLVQRDSAWRDIVARSSAEGVVERIWVAEVAGRVVGFASTGPSRDADAEPGTAEVYIIYLDPGRVGTGVGRALFAHATEDLRRRGFQAATLWVLEANARARRFYEAAGWRADGADKIERRPGFALHEVRYRIDFTRAAVGDQ